MVLDLVVQSGTDGQVSGSPLTNVRGQAVRSLRVLQGMSQRLKLESASQVAVHMGLCRQRAGGIC